MDPALRLATLHAGYSHSSLALASLKAFCRHDPFYSRIGLYEWLVKVDPAEPIAALTAGAPRLIGFSTYLWNVEATLAIAAAVKAHRPEVRIVLGGPEAGPRGRELLAAHPAIDFVVDGEGEEAFRDLARWALGEEGALQAIPGLIWRDGTTLRVNPQRAVDPAALASPLALGLVDLGKPLVYWETSRGCPFRCSFCTSAVDRLRTFPPERVDADLARLATLEKKTVKLLDRSFHLGRGRTLGLLRKFLETPASLRFHLELNPDRISPEALALFAEAPPGKFQFEIGLQTLDEAVLAAIDRQMAVPTALANIEALLAGRRHPVHLDLIVGLPGEGAERCRASLDRVFALHPDHLQLGTLKLLPGTPLRAQAAAFGYVFDPHPPYEVRAHGQLAGAEIVRFKRYAELLERLWNSALLRPTVAHLVAVHFGGAFSALADRLSEAAPLLLQRPSPERVFATVAEALAPELADDSVLRALFAWDVGHFALPGQAAPEVVRAAVEWVPLAVAGRRKRRPVYQLPAGAAAVVNRLRPQPLASGRYALWPQKHLPGRPVEIHGLDGRLQAVEKPFDSGSMTVR